jgi:endonuclease/exonuclease/phosphatase (EEP) superfamily protein YafD
MVALLVAGAGILVRWTVQDATLPAAVVFYALPRPVIAGLLVLACLARLATGARRGALPLAAAALAACVATCVGDFRWPACAPAPEDLKVLFWNCEHGRFGWEEVAASIAAQDADVIGLVEAGKGNPGRAAFWRHRVPGYDVWLPGRGLALFVRGTIESGRAHDLAGRGELAAARVRVRGRSLSVCVVDLHSSPVMKRRPPLDELARLLALNAGGPRIVLGDFNTPADSIWFRSLRADFTPAIEQAGSGWLPTWPGPVPVLGLDQVWTSLPARATCVTARFTTRSDHKQVLARVAVPASAPESAPAPVKQHFPGPRK